MLRATVTLVALALTSSSSALAAAGGCHAVSGTFTGVGRVPCTVPALACVETDVTGDLAGTSTTIVTAFDPLTSTYYGTVTNVLDNGAVITATIVGTAPSPGNGQSVETYTGGTRQYAHVTGSTTQVAVDSVGTYAGVICVGNGGKGGDD